jgi:putative ABC transport system permease protein
MKFEIKLGRYFSRDFPSDSTGILLNEAAAKEFGWENPLGEEVLYNDGTPRKLKVIGVFKNFNFESFKDQVRPISIILTKNSNTLLIRYDGKSTDIVATAERLWKQYAPNEPFEYSFMDQNFDRLFRSEQRMGQLFSVFSGLAILIACLGLFALAAFTAEQRTKEMGIRKSLGASTVSLNLLMSGEFIRLVIIAFVPAALLGWYVSDTWLTGFVYRIEISPLVFVLSGLTAVVIAWLTVSVQSLKAAAANPVKSLRYE